MDTLENSFTKVGLPVDEWSFYIRGRLSGSVAKQWVDVCEVEPTYRAARSSLLTAMGYTARKAGLTFYDMSPSDIKGMDADALVERGKSLYKRMHAMVKYQRTCCFIRCSGECTGWYPERPV